VRTPPKIASALLRYVGGLDEGAVGDLVEEFQSGKSSAWYWRQAAGIVSAAVLREVRLHPTAVALCLLLGWFCAWEVSTTVVRLTIDAVWRSYSSWYFANGGFPPPPLAPFTWILDFAIPIAANAFGGFAAARVYRGHRPVMALMFAVLVVLGQIAIFVWMSTTFDTTTIPAHYVFEPTPPQNVASFAMPPLAALLGGMLAARRQATKAA